MSVPVLEFFFADWQIIPPGTTTVQLHLTAFVPVAANAGIIVFARPMTQPGSPPAPWVRMGDSMIDNIPNTLPGETFQMPVKKGTDYVIRFQGEAHLLMPGFQDMEVGFEVKTPQALLNNYGGMKRATNTRAAGINGDAFLRFA